jgi:hypothetical protein
MISSGPPWSSFRKWRKPTKKWRKNGVKPKAKTPQSPENKGDVGKHEIRYRGIAERRQEHAL